MKRGLYGACTFLASLSLVIFAIGLIAWIGNLHLAHGRFILPGARSVGVRFDRATFAVGYDRPAGRPMLDKQGHLIDQRMREGVDVRNIPPPIDFQRYGFRYQHVWQGRSWPYISDGAGGSRPMTPTEASRLVPSELTTREETYVWGLPVWLLLLLFGAPPIYYFTGPRRHRRLLVHRCRNNLCVGCGYDLRASKDRCPECGMEIDAKSRVD